MPGFGMASEGPLLYRTGCKFRQSFEPLEVVGENEDVRDQYMRSVRAKKRGDHAHSSPIRCQVMYLYLAGNSIASTSGKISPFHYLCEGVLPWYPTSFSTS